MATDGARSVSGADLRKGSAKMPFLSENFRNQLILKKKVER